MMQIFFIYFLCLAFTATVTGQSFDDCLSVAPLTGNQLMNHWNCQASPKLLVPREKMQSWGHTQGIAVHENCIFISTQVKQIGANLIKFTRRDVKFVAHQWLSGKLMNHPSDMQICENTLAVAVAIPKRDSQSKIIFYDVEKFVPAGQEISFPDHIGALAFGKFKSHYYLFGGTWDSDRLVIFRSQQKTEGYQKIEYSNWTDLIVAGTGDNQKGKYNALHFYSRCQGAPLLYASYANSLDVWEIIGLAEDAIGLRKIASKNTTGYIKAGNGRLFHEGMDVHQLGRQIFYFAAPHDFHLDSQNKKYFSAPQIYICQPKF